MLDFIQQYLTGEEWEKLCNSCYRMKYQEEGYQEIPAAYRETVVLKVLRRLGLFTNVIARKKNIQMTIYINICGIK